MKTFAVALLALALVGAAQTPPRVPFVRQPDALADLTGTQVVLQAGLDRQTPPQNGLAALVAETILQTPVQNGASLANAVRAGGGSISYSMDPRDVRFYLEGTAAAYPALLALFHAALTKPDFSIATVNAARAALNRKIADNENLALNVGVQMLNQAFYVNSDAGMPRFGLSETLAGFTAADAQAFYAAHYRRGDALVSEAGNIAGPASDASAIVDGLPAGSSPAAIVRAAPLPSTSRQIIARRDVPVPWLVAQYHAPDLGSKDFGAMLILTEFMQRTLSDVADVPSIPNPSASQRGVGAFYNFDSSPANVIIYVDGGLGDPVRTFSMALGVVNVLGHAQLGGDLAGMKNFAMGRLLEDSQTLDQQTWLSAVFAGHNMGSDYRSQMQKAINATTARDLQRVAAKYLGAPTIALVVPRSQAQ